MGDILTDSDYSVQSADVSISNGGLFVKLGWSDYADCVQVTDLDSDCGADSMVLIEQGSAGLYASTFAALRAEWRTVMNSCGPIGCGQRITGMDRPTLRRALFAACWQYGHRDIDSSVTLYDASGAECANCEESVLRRRGRWEHIDMLDPRDSVMDDYTQFVTCADRPPGTEAAPRRPVAHEDGRNSWPDLLSDDWEAYADGDDGVWRYLGDEFGITR